MIGDSPICRSGDLLGFWVQNKSYLQDSFRNIVFLCQNLGRCFFWNQRGIFQIMIAICFTIQVDMVSLCSPVITAKDQSLYLHDLVWASSLVEITRFLVLMRCEICWVEVLYKRRSLECLQKHNFSQTFLLSSRFRDFVISSFSHWCEFSLCCWVLTTSQSSWVGKNVGEQKAVSMVPKKRIKLSHFDNSDLIAGYSKTLIGRCMNPRVQDMKTLLYMLRRIWQIEGKVAGAMVSLVRWSPSLNPNYSSDLTFWIRVLGVPIEFWADQTFREIGAALGSVQAVDVDAGRVRVTVDGFKPLSFETEIEYSNGEETTMFFAV